MNDSVLKRWVWVLRSKLHHLSVILDNFFTRHHVGFFVRWPQWLKAIFFLIPALTLLGIFTFYPIINSFIISFYTGYNIQTGTFVGYTFMGNYIRVLEHARFAQAVFNTTMIVVISVPVTILIGLLIAVGMNSIKPLKGFYQSIFFLPYVTNSIAIGLVFAFMFKGNSNDLTNLGLVNEMLSWFGIHPIVWIGVGASYWTALSVILVYSVWNGLAFKIIVFLAGIEGIDKQYYQAAQIDGASKYTSFARITVPMISPMIFYILITSVIGAFKTYSSVVAIIGTTGTITTGIDGEINLKTIVFYIYDYIGLAAQDGVMSLAAAAAIILFAIIFVFTIIQLQVGNRRVHY